MFPSINEQLDLIRRGAHEIIPEDELVRKLERSREKKIPLVVKLGCDPSRPDLHLGHAVVLRKLRDFQDLGHQAVLIVGDFTAMIGDPSGKSKTRPALTIEETRRNGQTYFEQATKILSARGIRMVYNSEWLARMSFGEVIHLASKYNVARMTERDDFEKRLKAGEPVSIHEFLYPLAQAMDSVAIKADVELGGTDQKFNLLVGRDVQREFNQEPQVILTMPILEGTDGVQKMSKSLDNYIAITHPPEEMYGRTLSIPDSLIARYFLLCTPMSVSDVKALSRAVEAGSLTPRDAKRQLAREIVALYHSREAARRAEEHFDAVFVRHEAPENVEEMSVKANELSLVALLVETKLAESKGDARRLVEGGGVSIDGERMGDANVIVNLEAPRLVKVGKRRFLKVYSSN